MQTGCSSHCAVLQWKDPSGKGALIFTLQIRTYLADGLSHNRKLHAADILAVVEETVVSPCLPRKKTSGPPVAPALYRPPATNQRHIVQRE